MHKTLYLKLKWQIHHARTHAGSSSSFLFSLAHKQTKRQLNYSCMLWRRGHAKGETATAGENSQITQKKLLCQGAMLTLKRREAPALHNTEENMKTIQFFTSQSIIVRINLLKKRWNPSVKLLLPTHHLQEWSAAWRCSQPPWSGWRCQSGTCWWWSSRWQPGCGRPPSASRSGPLDSPRWCGLFCEAWPHMHFQLWSTIDMLWCMIQCVCVCFFVCVSRDGKKGGKGAEKEDQESWGLFHQQPKASTAKVTERRRADRHVSLLYAKRTACKSDLWRNQTGSCFFS